MLYKSNKIGSWQAIMTTIVLLVIFVILAYAFLNPKTGILNKVKDSSSDLLDNNIDDIANELDNLKDDGLDTAAPEDLSIWFKEFENRLNVYKDDESCYILVPVFSGSSKFGVDKSNSDYTTITFKKSTSQDRSSIITLSQSYGSIDYDRFVLPLHVGVFTRNNLGLSDLEEFAGNKEIGFDSLECPECESIYFKTLNHMAFGDKHYDAERRNPKVTLYAVEEDDGEYYVLFKPHVDYYMFLERANAYYNGVIREIIEGNTHIKKC